MTDMPILLYDTVFNPYTLIENKPYKNITDILVNNCISVKRALKLCGTERRVVFGDGSDYERFYALCASMPNLIGHPVHKGVSALLSEIFGWNGEISLFTAEALWQGLNEVIEEAELTPISLLSMLNIESISVRRSPFFNKLPNINGIDLYTVTDLEDIYSLILNEGKNEPSLDGFLSKLISHANSYIRIKLLQDYRFVRNSKKLELEEFFVRCKTGGILTDTEINSLISYIIVSVVKARIKDEIGVILECHCPGYELSSLYSYLELNKALPYSTVLICEDARKYERFINSFTDRNLYGMPSIVPVCKDIKRLCEVFPIGYTMQYQEEMTDIVMLCSLIKESDTIKDTFGDEIAEALTYMNIKNRMKI